MPTLNMRISSFLRNGILAAVAFGLAAGAAQAQYMAVPYGSSTMLLPNNGQTSGFSNGVTQQPTFIIPNARLQPYSPPVVTQQNWQCFSPGHRC